jgi:hypothetical protein
MKATLGSNFTFSVCTHDPSTGVLTDADSVPAYRIYEDETATPILTGSMAKLDDTNTTGFYTEQIACTTANGFEDGKSYSIYITATVGGDTGGATIGLLVETATWSVSTRTLTSSSTAPGTGLTAQVWTVYRGDTLSRTFSTIAADGTITKCQLTVKSHIKQDDSSAALAIDSATGLLYLNGEDPGGLTATFVYTTGVLTVPADVMSELGPDDYVYDVQVWRTAVVSTIEAGTFRVTEDVTILT